jgi:hypothetical protein
MIITRQNAMGLTYQISCLGAGGDKPATIVLVGTGKKIVVDHSLDAINQSWFFWTSGKKIQEAFPFLNPEEREFLMTGITPSEWNEIFKYGDSEDNSEDTEKE